MFKADMTKKPSSGKRDASTSRQQNLENVNKQSLQVLAKKPGPGPPPKKESASSSGESSVWGQIVKGSGFRESRWRPTCKRRMCEMWKPIIEAGRNLANVGEGSTTAIGNLLWLLTRWPLPERSGCNGADGFSSKSQGSSVQCAWR